ncbi:putative gustatory receptor 22b [Drosophila teissieri]|uniref:putative gustatory receptor 22b n=1 Tax=Drosophila teissieri TaxID=7243 RepID=UPI001CBA0BA0|nr:putative gustatory receptor 22b [Drosophila teissieri]
MAGTSREVRPYLARQILRATLYGSWLFGLFPFTVDSGKRICQLRRSRGLVLYGLVANYFLIFILIQLAFEFKKQKLDVFERNPLLEIINIVISVINILSAILIHFMNFWSSRKVEEICNKLLTLEYQDFEGLNGRNCPNFSCSVIQKCLTTVGQLISFCTLMYAIPGNKSPLYLTLLSCLMGVSLNLNTMHYHIGVLLIYRYMWLINAQLKDLVSQLKLNPGTDSSSIHQFLSLYNRLLELYKKLAVAYQYQVILFITSQLAGNIVVIYFIIVYGISMRNFSIFLVVFPQSLLINIWDFWLFITVCDLTEKAGDETAIILKIFSYLEHRDDRLQTSVNEFAWLCSHRKFRFQLCGLFCINHQMGFKMIITTFLYLVYLVQFDYMNL